VHVTPSGYLLTDTYTCDNTIVVTFQDSDGNSRIIQPQKA
jgi:hypothetical protein